MERSDSLHDVVTIDKTKTLWILLDNIGFNMTDKLTILSINILYTINNIEIEQLLFLYLTYFYLNNKCLYY